MQSSNSFYVIDFTFAVLAPEGYENLTSLRLHWNDVSLKEKLLLHIHKNIKTKKNFHYNQAMALYISAVQLITRFSDEELNKKHFEYLDFWTNEAESYFDFKD